LHWAATNNVRREIVELLIANGADVNAMDSMAGMTPLHRATLDGYKEIAEEFIANGADVNAKDNNNETPPTHNNRNRGASGEGQVCRFTRGNAIALHLPVAVSKCRHPIPSA
jgi:ankyrin repeat protein